MSMGRWSKHAKLLKRLGGITTPERLYEFGRSLGLYAYWDFERFMRELSVSKQVVMTDNGQVMLHPKLELGKKPIVINWGDEAN